MAGAKSQANQADFLLRYTLQSFGIILLLGILIRIFLISSYVMSGTSMLPSIWPGDFLLAARWNLRDLRRGEIVALRCPQTREKLCLKRVIGLPGDRVEFRAGQLVLNGQEAGHRPIGPFLTEMAGGGSWTIWPEAGPPTTAVSRPLVVPPQMIFILNDKRADHEDSRNWGPVSEDLLEGRVLRIWMSLDWYDGTQVRAWPRLRWVRMFRTID